MKDFEHFVYLVFCGTEDVDDAYMAIQDVADTRDIYRLVNYFKDAAHQWRDQYLLAAEEANKSIEDLTEEEFLARFDYPKSSFTQ